MANNSTISFTREVGVIEFATLRAFTGSEITQEILVDFTNTSPSLSTEIEDISFRSSTRVVFSMEL